MKLSEIKFDAFNPLNTLLYFYVTKKGNWEEIQKSLVEKDELPDISDMQTTLEAWRKEVLEKTPEAQVISILDLTSTKAYPTWLTKFRRPPYVLVYTGSLETLKPKNKLLVVEDGSISKMLRRYGIAHGYADANGITTYINSPEVGDLVSTFVEDEATARERLVSIGDRFLAIDGNPAFLETMKMFKKSTDMKKLYALPGNAGCMCNKLIKSGWHLCDSGEDLISIPGSK